MPTLLSALALAASSILLQPEGDEVRIVPGEPLARAANIEPGESRYLRYSQGPDGQVRLVALESSIIRFIEQDGEPVWQIEHRGQGPDIVFGFTSTLEPQTLRPIAHERERTMRGEETRETFSFTPERVEGNASIQGEMQPLDVATPGGTFNFEIDLETLKALPWAAGRTIVIPFYHPGGSPPADYEFIVEREDSLEVAGAQIPVWIVTTDYNTSTKATFWIAKEDGTVLRVEQPLPNGGTFIKALVVSE